MRKVKFFSIIAVVLAAMLVACNKSEVALDNNVTPKQKIAKGEKYIPIAKIGENGEIEHLFLQKDVQEFFNKENPGEQLMFVEVQDDNKDGKNAGLLYRIYNEKEEFTETSISFVVIFEDGVYYAAPATSFEYAGGGTSTTTVSCTTSNAACIKAKGCMPKSDLTCSKCPSGVASNICTRTVSTTFTKNEVKVAKVIEYGTHIFAMYY